VTTFGESQFEHAYPDGVERHYWHRARTRLVADALSASRSSGAPVLDVGCGRGVTVAALRRLGFDCRGVELAAARPLPGVEAFVTTGVAAAELPAAERSAFGSVLLLDVLEHLEGPEEFLAAIPGSFPNVGSIVLTLPARPELWSNYDAEYGHFRRYTRESAERLVGPLGWRIAANDYVFRLLYPPMRLLAGSRRETVVRAPGGIDSVIHSALAAALVAESRWLPGWIPGTSLLMRLERPGRP
jgi:SAM-dependent methyltransferase